MLSSCYGYLLSLCFAFTAAAYNTTYLNGTSNPVVTVKNGSYIGIHNSAFNQDFFLGLPYAQVCHSTQHMIFTYLSSHQSMIYGFESLKA
jgi:hypothetical protein